MNEILPETQRDWSNDSQPSLKRFSTSKLRLKPVYLSLLLRASLASLGSPYDNVYLNVCLCVPKEQNGAGLRELGSNLLPSWSSYVDVVHSVIGRYMILIS